MTRGGVVHGLYGPCDCTWLDVGSACRRLLDAADLARRSRDLARLAVLSGITLDEVLEVTVRTVRDLRPEEQQVRARGLAEDRDQRRAERDPGGEVPDPLVASWDAAVDSDQPLLVVRCFERPDVERPQ